MRMSKKIPIAGAPTRSVGRKGTLANCLSMGMEPATHTGKADARRGASGDGVGPTYRNGSPVLYVGRSARRVWPVEVRWRGGTSVWSFHSRCLHLARGWKTPLSSRSQPVVERSTPRECLYPACRLPRLPDRLPALCFAGAVLGIRSQRRSGASRQRRPRLLPPPAEVSRKPVKLGPIRWVDVAGRALRRTWTAHWRGQYVEVLALA